jgi:hypothetical protein
MNAKCSSSRSLSLTFFFSVIVTVMCNPVTCLPSPMPPATPASSMEYSLIHLCPHPRLQQTYLQPCHTPALPHGSGKPLQSPLEYPLIHLFTHPCSCNPEQCTPFPSPMPSATLYTLALIQTFCNPVHPCPHPNLLQPCTVYTLSLIYAFCNPVHPCPHPCLLQPCTPLPSPMPFATLSHPRPPHACGPSPHPRRRF